MLLNGKGDKEILIISIYQCCKSPTNLIGNTAYHQQQTLLSEKNRKDIDPRRNFYKDLKKFIQEIKARPGIATVPILMGDFNEELTYWTSTKVGYSPYVMNFSIDWGGIALPGLCTNSNGIMIVRKL